MSASFTCPTQTDISPSEIPATYSEQGVTPLLPSSILGSDREANQMIKESALKAHLAALERIGAVPTMDASTPYTVYRPKVKKLLENAQKEYCFYDARYKAALQRLFTVIRGASMSPSQEAKQTIAQRLAVTQTVNRKLNDLLQIIRAITQKMMDSSSTMESEIATFHRQLREMNDKLQEQNKTIQNNESVMRLQKEMVKYTEEKGRHTNNLLKVYSVLNIVALGLLLYVYKAVGDE